MSKINFNEFTLSAHEVDNLSKVLFTSAFKLNPLFDFCTQKPGVVNGEKLDYVDNLGDLGTAGRSCDPEYTGVEIKGLEKEWELGDWTIAKKICYKTLENTIAEYCLRTGTPRENIIGTEFWDKILIPLFDKALTEMYVRLAWFTDKDAKNVSQSGVITDGVDTSLLTIADGLFARLFAIAAADTNKRTVIAANAEGTYKEQSSALKGSGVALSIIDDLLENADSRIADREDSQITMTNSLYQALRKDYADKYKQTIPFMEYANGVKLPTYDGVKIRVFNQWDALIKKFEDTGTKLRAPHRAVYAPVSNLFVGTSDSSIFADFDTFFDQKTRNNHMYAASNIGTLVGEDDLIQIAY